MSAMSRALTGPDRRGRGARGSVRDTVVPRGETIFSTTYGRIRIPALPIAAGDHRHLERRHEHALLPERHPAGVDVASSRFGYQSSPFR